MQPAVFLSPGVYCKSALSLAPKLRSRDPLPERSPRFSGRSSFSSSVCSRRSLRRTPNVLKWSGMEWNALTNSVKTAQCQCVFRGYLHECLGEPVEIGDGLESEVVVFLILSLIAPPSIAPSSIASSIETSCLLDGIAQSLASGQSCSQRRSCHIPEQLSPHHTSNYAALRSVLTGLFLKGGNNNVSQRLLTENNDEEFRRIARRTTLDRACCAFRVGVLALALRVGTSEQKPEPFSCPDRPLGACLLAD